MKMSCCSYLCCSYQVRRKVARKHRRRLWRRFLSNIEGRSNLALRAGEYPTITASVAYGCRSPLRTSAIRKCSIWLHIFISKHWQRWCHFPDFWWYIHDMDRLEMFPQMEPVYTNIVTLSTHSCMQTTSNTTSASRGPWKMQIQQLLM